MKSHRILPAALLLCTFAACGPTPTGSDPQAHPAGASYDGGGFTIGSARNTEEPGDSTTTASTGGFGMGGGRSEEDGSTSTSSTQDAERGGYTIGSGG